MQPWQSVLLIISTLIIFGAGFYYDQIEKDTALAYEESIISSPKLTFAPNENNSSVQNKKSEELQNSSAWAKSKFIIEMQDITLVIPAKYESESLPVFLNEIKHLKSKKLIVLQEDDDETINSIREFKDIEILYQIDKGYGAAILEGIKHTSTSFFCIINADGSMNPDYLDKMLFKTKQNDLNASDEDAACRIIEGTARSMGIEVSN